MLVDPGLLRAFAAQMFRRATDASSEFSLYTEGVAAALSKGAVAIGAARTALLNHADSVVIQCHRDADSRPAVLAGRRHGIA